jgi:hypothetical protein
VQACDSDDDVNDDDDGDVDDDGASTGSCGWVHPADDPEPVVPQQKLTALGLLWQGDDDEALGRLLESEPVDVYQTGTPLQINSIVLAHRLGRVRCAKVLFDYAFNALAAPLELGSGGLAQPGAAASNTHHAAATLYGRCLDLVRAQLQGELGLIGHYIGVLRQDLKGSGGIRGATAGQRMLVNDWIRAGILGHLLTHFDQDALHSGSRFGHWPALLSETAEALNYPLDKEPLLIGFGLPVCGGAPEPG